MYIDIYTYAYIYIYVYACACMCVHISRYGTLPLPVPHLPSHLFAVKCCPKTFPSLCCQVLFHKTERKNLRASFPISLLSENQKTKKSELCEMLPYTSPQFFLVFGFLVCLILLVFFSFLGFFCFFGVFGCFVFVFFGFLVFGLRYVGGGRSSRH